MPVVLHHRGWYYLLVKIGYTDHIVPLIPE